MSYAREATEELPDVIYAAKFKHGFLGRVFRIYNKKGSAQSQITRGDADQLWAGFVVWKRIDE